MHTVWLSRVGLEHWDHGFEAHAMHCCTSALVGALS